MSNAYDRTRGNVLDRKSRRLWLLETYRADVDVFTHWGSVELTELKPARLGTGIPACRCYRCGKLLTLETLTVDRIKPGCEGGTYARTNIRPSCSDCANKQGAELRARLRAK